MNNKTLIPAELPIRACWLLTSRCNYSCQFCHRVLNKRELYFNEAVSIVDKLAEAGIKKVSFSGGEPMLWNGLYDLIAYAKSKGLITMLITNASLMSDSMLMDYAKILDWITFPIDGSNEHNQVLMTRAENHFSRILHQLDLIEKHNLAVKVKINTVCAKPNKDDIINIAKIIQEHPSIERWKVFQFYPVRGLALHYQDQFLLDKQEFLSIAENVVAAYPEIARKNVFFATNHDLDRSYFTLAPDGTVYLSAEGKDFFMGNLLTSSVEEIWKSKLYDKKSHKRQARWVLEYVPDARTTIVEKLKRKNSAFDGGE
jgi:radical S-adenosyl methionine domain-containing protein 2